jgi:murein DD-endopeptidase MepM/ murein hydrolase activator NlpD
MINLLGLIESDTSIERILPPYASQLDIEYPQPPNTETPSYWPTNSIRITSNFDLVHPLGIDIGAVEPGVAGDPVWASRGGEVTTAGNPDWSPSGSSYVIIRGVDGREYRYVHMGDLDVQVEDDVVQGQQIGEMGDVGAPEGVHLHYEIREDGVPIDPTTLPAW